MLKKLLPLLVVALSFSAQATLASEYIFVNSNIQQGEIQVAETTTVSFTFNKPMYVFEDLESILEFITPIPSDKIEIIGFRYTNENKTIELDVEHAYSTDYYWIVWDVLFADGNSLTKNEVLYYTTANHKSQKVLNGQLIIKELGFKSTPDIFKHPFRSNNFKPRTNSSSVQDTEFNLAKTIVFLSEELIEDLEESGLDAIKAAGSTTSSGYYDVRNIRPGHYYVYALLLDGDAFAVGAYDGNEDGEPDLIDFTGPENYYDAHFYLYGFKGSDPTGYTLSETYPEAKFYAKLIHSDARLMQIQGMEELTERLDDGTYKIHGRSFLWTFTYYSPSTDEAFVVISTPYFTFHAEVDNEMHGMRMAQIMPLNMVEFRSDIAAHYAYAYGGADFIRIFPDEGTQFTVFYEVSAAAIKYPEIFINLTIPYWDVQFQGMYNEDESEMKSGLYDQVTVLINATNGQLIYKSNPTSVDDPVSEIPTELSLEQNYPNPFNPSTTIQFALPSAGDVKIQVFDLLGREVTTLLNGALPQGNHQVIWNATNVSSGTYFYRLESGNQVQIRKMTLVK